MLTILLRLLLFVCYSLHCEVRTGNTFLVIGNNEHAIHDGFRGQKGRSARFLLDPSLQEDSTINNLAANTHIIGSDLNLFSKKKTSKFF